MSTFLITVADSVLFHPYLLLIVQTCHQIKGNTCCIETILAGCLTRDHQWRQQMPAVTAYTVLALRSNKVSSAERSNIYSTCPVQLNKLFLSQQTYQQQQHRVMMSNTMAELTPHVLMKPLPYAVCSVTTRSRSSLF